MFARIATDGLEEIGTAGRVFRSRIVILTIGWVVPLEGESKFVICSVLALIVEEGDAIITGVGVSQLCKLVADHMFGGFVCLLNSFDLISLSFCHPDICEILSWHRSSNVQLT